MHEVVVSYHLSAKPDLYEPARNNNFRFVVTNIDGLIEPGTEDQVIANAQSILEFSVVSVTVPTFTQEPITIRRGNSVMKAAGIPSFNEGSLVINDFITANGKSILLAWQGLSYDVDNEVVNPMSTYKKDCWLIEYDVNFSRIVRQWILYGCWISALSQDAFNVENGDKRQITATIQYDKAKVVVDGNE